jgi:hypothetical protein
MPFEAPKVSNPVIELIAPKDWFIGMMRVPWLLAIPKDGTLQVR